MRRHNSLLHPCAVAAAFLVLTALGAAGRALGEGTEAAGRDAASAAGDIRICDALTAEQVSTVLPKHDGGTQMASGPSPANNIKLYQCSYGAVRGTDVDFLTVVVLVGADRAAFEFIKPNRSAKRDSFPIFQELKIGDGGMLYGKPGEIEAETWKGTTVVSLKLVAPEAERHADAIVRLTSIVVTTVK
jgi:hypothetical protein